MSDFQLGSFRRYHKSEILCREWLTTPNYEDNVLLTCSTETAIKLWLTKLVVHMYSSFYCAFQCFGDVYLSSMKKKKKEEAADFLSRKNPKTKRPRSRKHASHPVPEEEPCDDEGITGSERMSVQQASKLKDKIEDEDFVAVHDSGSVLSSGWQWPIYDTNYKKDGSYLKLREESKGESKDEKTKMVPFVVVYLNLKNLPLSKQVEVNISSPFLKELLSGKKDRWRCKKIVTIDGPELSRGYEILRIRRETCAAKLLEVEASTSAGASSRDKEEPQHVTHLLRFMDKELE